MLDDIFNETFFVEIDNIKCKFEFNHFAYATLEKETEKSIYYFYEELILGKDLKLVDWFSFIRAGMLKNHSSNEIETVVNSLQESIYKIENIKNYLIMAFIKPLLPPEVIGKFKKKRQAIKKSKNSKT